MSQPLLIVRLFFVVTAAVTAVATSAFAQSLDPLTTRRWTAAQLFAEGVSTNLRLSADGTAIELIDGELIEDDGPAAGFSYLPNEEKLGPDVRIKKTLLVDDPRTHEAILLVGTGGKIEAVINGDEASLEPLGKEGNYWQKFRFAPTHLKKGPNEIVLRGTGSVFIARDEDFAKGSTTRTKHPNRSAKSSDGGKTWTDTELGTKGDVDGEYYVRLFLKRHPRMGILTLPPIDLGNLAGLEIPPPSERVSRIDIRPKVDVNTARFGGSTQYLNTPLSENFVENGNRSGRYLQLRYEIGATPLATARLTSLEISASSRLIYDWTKSLKLVGKHNPELRRSSIPFAYEKFDHPELKRFREEHKLDELTAGAKSEWELIERLAAWATKRWEKGHLNKIYPAWNAREILKPADDGTPIGGFCQQYNLVLLQACESFGLVGRIVSLGSGNMTDKIRSGHETCEIWSNDFDKWVYIDGNTGWYLVDLATKIPLSHLELRERQLAFFAERDFKPVEVRTVAETKYKWDGLKSFPPFVELRMIPRSNFLETQVPLPLNQGMRGWFWTGHHVWSDDTLPAAMLYGLREHRRENWDWSVNQVHITLEPTQSNGEFRVHCDTVTPGFETFTAKIDDGEAQPVKSGFTWALHPGKNRVEVRSRNITGRAGAASWIEIDRPSP
ncbi:MAG: hypothetical protein K8U03_00030 [Planctomycetia bacterium]|nr:hypothetical protein [Planctomycetia bacterium]